MTIPCNSKVTVYLPIPKTKQDKASIRGFWRGNKLFYDYIVKVKVDLKDLEALRIKHNQVALFYTKNSKAYVYNGTNTQELKYYQYIPFPKQFKALKYFLKSMLKIYGGFTIYIKDSKYLIEVWS